MNDIFRKAINPILPKKFDENEWFVIIITIVICLAVYYVFKQKKFLLTEIICILLFNLQLTTIGDYYLAMPPYDFYDTVDRPSGELSDIALHSIIYPGSLLFLMHCFKSWKTNVTLFIVSCAILLTVLEVISVYIFHLIVYKGWNIYYSSVFYLFVMVVNVIFYKKLSVFIKRKLQMETS